MQRHLSQEHLGLAERSETETETGSHREMKSIEEVPTTLIEDVMGSRGIDLVPGLGTSLWRRGPLVNVG